MPYIDESWTEEQKALVMADEAIKGISDTFNELVERLDKNPEILGVLVSIRPSIAHAIAVNGMFIRKSVPDQIWSKVDEDAKKKEQELKEMFEGHHETRKQVV